MAAGGDMVIPCGWACAAKREGRDGGRTFAKKWKYALSIGPRVALVPSWGQWVGCEAKPGENQNEEYSTDLELKYKIGANYVLNHYGLWE